jgi:hypothetical protein
MNVEELLNHQSCLFSKAEAILARKNHDYAGAKGETPFRNFTRCQDFGICTTEKGILVRMTDKMSRLSTYLEGTKLQVADETFDDTLLDLINYCVILSAYIAEQGERE